MKQEIYEDIIIMLAFGIPEKGINNAIHKNIYEIVFTNTLKEYEIKSNFNKYSEILEINIPELELHFSTKLKYKKNKKSWVLNDFFKPYF